MKGISETVTLCEAEAMLEPVQLEAVSSFLISCRRLAGYLKKAETVDESVACYGRTIYEMQELRLEIERCIRSGMVDSRASGALEDIRRRLENAQASVREKLNALLKAHKKWFADGFVSNKNGRLVLPVKREYKTQVKGSVVEVSTSGATCFMEPESVAKVQREINQLQIEEDCEIRRILYTLTALVDDHLHEIRRNMEATLTLDILFAKAKFSAQLNASEVKLTMERRLELKQARHPLLEKHTCVPLNICLSAPLRGAIITGPNTGGKTVVLKTVGLLCTMAQSGLHIPADEGCVLPLCDAIYCDIGDGQSIAQNLSTFSAHMCSVIEILSKAGEMSLVLLDELGSGTDPAEGMGIAVAVLEELRQRNCLILATTHYPEVKQYAAQAEGFSNARMEFDPKTLEPLYRLQLGEAGESCALHIAKRLGLPAHMLKRAHEAAYRQGRKADSGGGNEVTVDGLLKGATTKIHRQRSPKLEAERRESINKAVTKFQMGDSVIVVQTGETGIVFQPADERGEVCVQVKGEKKMVGYKRLKLQVPASELYPSDYDFSIIFDTVENRKANHKMEKGYCPKLQIVHRGADAIDK